MHAVTEILSLNSTIVTDKIYMYSAKTECKYTSIIGVDFMGGYNI